MDRKVPVVWHIDRKTFHSQEKVLFQTWSSTLMLSHLVWQSVIWLSASCRRNLLLMVHLEMLLHSVASKFLILLDSSMTWVTRDTVMKLCTMDLQERNRKSSFSWVQLIIRDLSIWSETRCTQEEEDQPRSWQDSQLRVDPVMVVSDSEKWKEIAWSLMELLASWKREPWMYLTSTESMCAITAASLLRQIFHRTLTIAEVARTSRPFQWSTSLMLVSCYSKSSWLWWLLQDLWLVSLEDEIFNQWISEKHRCI